MRMLQPCVVVLAMGMISPAVAAAQRQTDIDAINQLIDRYGALEDAMDMNGQAQLMTADRVWIGQGAGRRTDQATNMRIQQTAFDQLEKAVPGIQRVTEDRDRLIKFYGNASVAVASFYRYTTIVVPAGVPREVAEGLAETPPNVVTLVPEKQDGTWKIVHSHFSALGPAGS